MINVLLTDGTQDSVLKIEDMDFNSFDLDVIKNFVKGQYANFFKNCPLNYAESKDYFKEDICISIIFIYDKNFEHSKQIKQNNSFYLRDIFIDYMDEIMKGDKVSEKV